MKLINYTKHVVQIWHENKSILSIAPESEPLRCKENYEFLEYVEDPEGIRVEIGNLFYSSYIELPWPEEDTLLIVSVLVAQQYRYRSDLVVPYDLVRNENGSVIGCRKLVRMI